jgi:hypothetical protein
MKKVFMDGQRAQHGKYPEKELYDTLLAYFKSNSSRTRVNFSPMKNLRKAGSSISLDSGI